MSIFYNSEDKTRKIGFGGSGPSPWSARRGRRSPTTTSSNQCEVQQQLKFCGSSWHHRTTECRVAGSQVMQTAASIWKGSQKVGYFGTQSKHASKILSIIPKITQMQPITIFWVLQRRVLLNSKKKKGEKIYENWCCHKQIWLGFCKMRIFNTAVAQLFLAVLDLFYSILCFFPSTKICWPAW